MDPPMCLTRKKEMRPNLTGGQAAGKLQMANEKTKDEIEEHAHTRKNDAQICRHP
jgi:hypothetical protein